MDYNQGHRQSPGDEGAISSKQQTPGETLIEDLLSDLDFTGDDLAGTEADAKAETPLAAAERLAADQEQVRVLIAAGFKGPQYERFRDELWTYAMRVIRNFLRTGRISELCAARNVPIHMSEHARRALHTSPETRDEFAVDTISWSIEYFRDEVLAKSKWRPGPGAASLRSFFIGACAFGFQRVLRDWQARHQEVLTDEGQMPDLLQAPDLDPAERAALTDTLRRIMDTAKPEVRHICRLILQDFSYAEIADQIGISERAVEGHMYRLRKHTYQMVQRGQIEPLTRNTMRVGRAA